jgi:hypothetical protein
MKLYAQHGHAASDKMHKAVEGGYIDGVILSPRYLTPESANHLVEELRDLHGGIDVLFDPEFYAIRYIGTPNAQLRHLEEWPHFLPKRRNELLVGTSGVDAVLRAAYEVQAKIGCTHLIAPSIYVTNSFDSIEAAIAISFVSRAKPVATEMEIDLPVYATVAVGRDAIVDRHNYLSFLNAITGADPAPDGVYALVGAGSTDERVGTVRSEIMNPEVIAGWMLFNYGLSLNNMNVVNGFSDILTPWLGVAGGYAGSTGWWSNLQVFSMARYVRGPGGGQLPLVRYLSMSLLNRITVNEREAFVEFVPDIMNGLSTDSLYEGREPSRTDEALQSWQAITGMSNEVISSNVSEGIARLNRRTIVAREYYDKLQQVGFSERYEANMEFLAALRDSLTAFVELAEL